MHQLRKLEFELPYAVCKNRCLFCSNYGGIPVASPICEAVCQKIVDDFAGCGGETLVITGGEPLECPFFFQIMEYARNKGLNLHLYTSGYLVRDLIIASKIASYVNQAYITILGSETVHDFLTNNVGSYELSISAISLLSKENVDVGINFIPMRPNWKEWKTVLENIDKAGANEFRITEFMPQGRGWNNRAFLELNLHQYREMLEDMAMHLPQIFESTNVRLNTEGICFGFLVDASVFPSPKCSAGKWGLTITPEGYIIPCLGCRTKPGLRIPDTKYILGKYTSTEENVLETVWNESVVLQQFRNLKLGSIRGTCRECVELKKCGGGCPIRREIETGNIEIGPDYKCIMNPARC